MNETALITGATSGIGYELAYIHAKHGGNLVLVARNKTKLEQIKKDLENNYNINAHIIEKDLSLKDSGKDVYDEIKNNNITVDYLINNAGFGDYGFFNDSDWGKLERMINLNITALTQLTKLFISDMIKQGSGKIMNVASTAAFQPGPTMAVYYATKAYVLSFSEAINNEVSGSGVTVTTLCPGPTKSGFQEAASLHESRLVKGRILATSKEVAEYGYNAMLKGKSVAIPGFVNYLIANSVRFFPRSAVVRVARFIQDKR
jgi:short-subunit dehydrogenase